MHRLALAFWLAVVAVAPAWADNQHQEGVYTGAKPGVRPGAEVGHPQKKPAPGTLSWIGFEAKDSSATVWLQAANPFEISQRVQGGTLIVSISGLRRLGRNTWRPVDTRYFDNPLSRITGTKHKKGLEVRIVFKNAKDAKDASVRTATEADGLYYTYLSFPPGTDLPAADTTTPSGTVVIDPDSDVER